MNIYLLDIDFFFYQLCVEKYLSLIIIKNKHGTNMLETGKISHDWTVANYYLFIFRNFTHLDFRIQTEKIKSFYTSWF